MYLTSWKFQLPFLIILFFYFLFWIRKTKWNLVHKQYPAEKSSLENLKMNYGIENVGGVYNRNAVFSAIEKDGIFMRKPFPFSIFMPAIFIPWEHVQEVSIIDNIDKLKPSKYKMVKMLNPFKYANIKINTLLDIPIAIKWKDSFRGKIPKNIKVNL
jgi:hypothetical protein